MDMPKYHVDVFWSDEDECWIANVPDLEYCSAHGQTAVEALSELMIAQALWLEVAREHGDEIPSPQYVSLASHPWLKAPASSNR